MANVFNSKTLTWQVTETGALTTESANMERPIIAEIIYVPSAVNDDVAFQDGDASENAIVLKAGPTDVAPIHKSFRPQGKRVCNLTCSTIDGGTAYVYIL